MNKPQFVKQANVVCVTAQREREAQSKEFKPGAESAGSDDPEAVMRQLLEPVNAMIEELSDLSPPKGQEKQVDAIIEAYEAGVSELEADPGGADSASAFDKASKLAEGYGLTNCTI